MSDKVITQEELHKKYMDYIELNGKAPITLLICKKTFVNMIYRLMVGRPLETYNCQIRIEPYCMDYTCEFLGE